MGCHIPVDPITAVCWRICPPAWQQEFMLLGNDEVMSRWPSSSAVCLCRMKATGMMFASSPASNLLILPSLSVSHSKGVLGCFPTSPPMQNCQPCCGKGSLVFFQRYYSNFGAQTSAGKGNISVLITGASFRSVLILPLMVPGGVPGFPPRPFLSPLVLLTFGSSSVRHLQANIDLCCSHSAEWGEWCSTAPSPGWDGAALLNPDESHLELHYSCVKGEQ